MDDMTSQLLAAFEANRTWMFVAVEINLNTGRDVRMLDGVGSVTWSQGTFNGTDQDFGSIASIQPISDGTGDSAPLFNIGFFPADDADAVDISHPDLQGSRIRVWIGALDQATGAVIPDPYLLFDGELDVPTIQVQKRVRKLDYECVSRFERFFLLSEGNRLNPTHHKDVWPGETGLDDVTGVVKRVVWGPGHKIGASGNIGNGGNPPEYKVIRDQIRGNVGVDL